MHKTLHGGEGEGKGQGQGQAEGRGEMGVRFGILGRCIRKKKLIETLIESGPALPR